jgi:hypothetical protein
MGNSRDETILLVCDCEMVTEEILSKLYDGGFSVIGPVPNASLALALAAQSSPTMALVATATTGRRSAVQLADDLMKTWGIRSWLLEDALEGDKSDVWSVPDDRVAHIQRALEKGAPRQVGA